MKLSDAIQIAADDGERWSDLPFVERLNRLDTDEGHSIYERYFGEHDPTKAAYADPHWSVLLQRTWLCWALGVDVAREVWRPNYLRLVFSVGPFHLSLTREWGGQTR